MPNTMRRLERLELANGAKGFIDQFNYPKLTSKPRASAASPAGNLLGMTPDDLTKFRLWLHKVNKECEERLSRENVVVYKLNKQRTMAELVGYMTKGEAAKAVREVVPGELLDLDNYGGIFIRADHLFISETKAIDGLSRCGPDATTGELIHILLNDRMAA